MSCFMAATTECHQVDAFVFPRTADAAILEEVILSVVNLEVFG